MTNFEKIKSMTQEEMAAFLDKIINEGNYLLSEELESHGFNEQDIADGIDECNKWLSIYTI